MATVTQPRATQSSPAARRAQVMRDYWDRARGPATTVLGTIGAFFVAYPPLAQGIYYLMRGLWSLLGHGTTETAPEYLLNAYLVHSTGVLVLVIGAALCLAAWRRQGSPEVLLIALGSAIGLIVIDLIYIFNRSISVLYIFDVIIQAGLVAAWVQGWRKGKQELTQAAATTPAPAAPVPTTPAPAGPMPQS